MDRDGTRFLNVHRIRLRVVPAIQSRSVLALIDLRLRCLLL